MPYRVQQIEDIVKQLESGDLKLRVGVLEVISSSKYFQALRIMHEFMIHIFLISQSKRAAEKATILQMATIYSVLGGVLGNLGVALSIQGRRAVVNGSFIGAGEYSYLPAC